MAGHLVTLFRHQFFQALQRNESLPSLSLCGSLFPNSDDAEGFVSFLDDSPPALTELTLTGGGAQGGDIVATNIATALQRNSRIQTLVLSNSDLRGNSQILCSILQGLASSNSVSRLETLDFRNSYEWSDDLQGALEEYLGSPNATIGCFILTFRDFGLEPCRILCGLHRNMSINELVLTDCSIRNQQEEVVDSGDSDQDEAFSDDNGDSDQDSFSFDDNGDNGEDEDDVSFDEQPAYKQLLILIQSKANLSTVRILSQLLLDSARFAKALYNALVRRDSPLSCLELEHAHFNHFRALLTAVSNSIQLKMLILRCYDDEQCWELAEALPSLKITELRLTIGCRYGEEAMIEAFKKNYCIQRVQCVTERDGGPPWFSDANQARLEFFLDRNRKLAQWTANPQLVPKELWFYAVNLALKAGINSPFESLMSLSGHGVGLQEKGQTEKRAHNQDGPPPKKKK